MIKTKSIHDLIANSDGTQF